MLISNFLVLCFFGFFGGLEGERGVEVSCCRGMWRQSTLLGASVLGSRARGRVAIGGLLFGGSRLSSKFWYELAFSTESSCSFSLSETSFSSFDKELSTVIGEESSVLSGGGAWAIISCGMVWRQILPESRSFGILMGGS